MRLEPGRYVCPVCDRRFHSTGDKKRHMKNSHPKP